MESGIVSLSMSSANLPTPLLNFADPLFPPSHALDFADNFPANAVDAKRFNFVFCAVLVAADARPFPAAFEADIIPLVAKRSTATCGITVAISVGIPIPFPKSSARSRYLPLKFCMP